MIWACTIDGSFICRRADSSRGGRFGPTRLCPTNSISASSANSPIPCLIKTRCGKDSAEAPLSPPGLSEIRAAVSSRPLFLGAGSAMAARSKGLAPCAGERANMTHLWVRAEQRPNEERVGLTPEGAAALVKAGIRVTVEESSVRAIGIDGYKAGGGTLYDLEYLVDESGRRVAAFGYWAGYAGAALSLKCWAAQQHGGIAGPVAKYPGKAALLADLGAELAGLPPPRAIVIGALGRVGTGASDLCAAMGVAVTKWGQAETASGGPFPEILQHEIFLNCILSRPGCPVFVPASAKTDPRQLTVIRH